MIKHIKGKLLFMKKLIKANPNDLDKVYAMGYDVWGEGKTYQEYIEECRSSVKYKKGIWYILSVDGETVSSCILYYLTGNTIGIGSLATVSEKRGLGYASSLLNEILNRKKDYLYFLWSDITTTLYENVGFVVLEDIYQTHKGSSLMYYPSNYKIDFDNLPNYF